MSLCLCGESCSCSPPRSSASSAFNDPSALRHPAPSQPSAFSSSLFAAFIRARFDLAALLSDPRFTPDQVLAFVSDPATQSRLADLARVAHAGLTVRAAEARQVAIAALEEVAKTAEDPIEKRRAASALFRATASPLVPLAASVANTTSPTTAPPTPRPVPPVVRSMRALRPADVALYAMRSLRDCNVPEPRSGIATLAELSEPSINVDGRDIPTTDLDALETAIKQTCLRHVPASTYLGAWGDSTIEESSSVECVARFSCNTKNAKYRIHIRLRRKLRDQRSDHWLIYAVTHSPGP